uniref:glucose-6-phosphate 1-epimerase n=1 Tax=Peronospora matthiolae TaxID=2874970 RepID=A0AAV1V7W1_9STRA
MVHSFLLKISALTSSTLLASTLLASPGAANPAPGTVLLEHVSGSRAEVAVLGAQVISFYTADNPNVNVLFMADDPSTSDGVTPIQGGLTPVFPYYGTAPSGYSIPLNGFARTMKWEVSSVTPATNRDRPTYAFFNLESTDATMQMWPFKFKLMYQLELRSSSLEIMFSVIDTHPAAISFHALIQNYFSVPDIRNDGVTISGLKNVNFFDRISKTNQLETRESFGILSQIDNIYKNVTGDVVAHIRGEHGDWNVIVAASAEWGDGAHRSNIPPTDRTVWNHGNSGAKDLGDFGDEKYLRTIAIGSGNVAELEELYPSLRYDLTQVITVAKA